MAGRNAPVVPFLRWKEALLQGGGVPCVVTRLAPLSGAYKSLPPSLAHQWHPPIEMTAILPYEGPVYGVFPSHTTD